MSLFDRLAQGPGNMQAQDVSDWNQMVGSAPPGQFQQHAYNAIQQVSPEEYYQHTQPGVMGTDPFGSLPQPQQQGLGQSLLGALLGTGAQPQQVIGGGYGQQFDPNNLSPQQMAAMAQYLHQNNPQALGQVASQYQNQPDMLQSLLGNKALMAVAAGLGAKYLSDRAQGRSF